MKFGFLCGTAVAAACLVVLNRGPTQQDQSPPPRNEKVERDKKIVDLPELPRDQYTLEAVAYSAAQEVVVLENNELTTLTARTVAPTLTALMERAGQIVPKLATTFAKLLTGPDVTAAFCAAVKGGLGVSHDSAGLIVRM